MAFQEPAFPNVRLTVDEVLRLWPAAAAVFLRRRLACPGCAMAPFETLSEVAEVYRLDLKGFVAELGQAADGADVQTREESER